MSVHSFSFRQVSRPLVLRSLEEHEWSYDAGLLSHMHNNYPVYVEMGGLLGISYALRTDTEGGLRDDEKHNNYERRKALYLINELPLPPVRHPLEHALEAISDPMMIILMIGGIVSIAANTAKHPDNGWIDGVAILIAVLLVVLVSSYNNYSQEVSFLKLASSLKGAKVTVTRHKAPMAYEQDELLVGDIVHLNPGAMIPADGVLVDQTTIKVNESSLTGESDEVTKSPQQPFMSAGTELTDGTCDMLVTAVGINSAKGKLMASLAQAQKQTQLQERLEHVAGLIGYIGLTCSIGTFLALLIRWLVEVGNDKTKTYKGEWTDIIDFFIIAITVVVVAIPEGLPLAVTVSLAYSMAKMREDQNLVKVLSACETMGNATAICSDKTGTLTQNKMTVVQTYLGGRFFPRQAQAAEISPALHELLVDGVVCNSDRRVPEDKMDFKVAPEDWKWEGDGGATEAALLAWLSRYHEPPASAHIMQLRAANNPRVIQFFPFSSAKKVSSVIMSVEMPPQGIAPDPNRCRRYYKGAADRVIKSCTRMVDLDGKVMDVGSTRLVRCQATNCKREAMRGAFKDVVTHCAEHSDPDMLCNQVCRFNKNGHNCNKWAVMGEQGGVPLYCTDPNHHPAKSNQLYLLDQHPYKVMTNMTREGLRCIAFAYIDDVKVEMKDGQLKDKDVGGDSNWTLIGLAGIKDPLRVETRDAVMTCQQAGIVVRMVTGDNIDTARFIAQDCGIITHPRHRAMEGADFRQALEDHEAHKRKTGEDLPDFVELVKYLRVMARCQPEDKLELVKFLREHGDVVGVTGDGSNDGPALKAADVGLAMGIAGTDVAKAAASVIILDDNFSSIVKSVLWGRCVYDNIRKFIQFQCSVNVCALAVVLVGAIVDGSEPLRPVQLLWVNLIMDTMGALALGTEKPKPILLQRRPYAPDGPLISKLMWRNIFGQGLSQLAVLYVILYGGKDWLDGRFYDNGVYDQVKHYTLIFNTFVWLQFWNEINSRKVNTEMNFFEGFFENFWFTGVLIVTAGFQILMVEIFGSFASTTHQEWDLWLIAIAFGATQLITGMLLRFWHPDPTQGQIAIEPSTFEGAAWIDNPELGGALFRPHPKGQPGEAGTAEVKRVSQELYEPPPGTVGILVYAPQQDAGASSGAAAAASGGAAAAASGGPGAVRIVLASE